MSRRGFVVEHRRAVELGGLLLQAFGVPGGGKPNEPEPVWVLAHDVQGLGSDAARGAENDDAVHGCKDTLRPTRQIAACCSTLALTAHLGACGAAGEAGVPKIVDNLG